MHAFALILECINLQHGVCVRRVPCGPPELLHALLALARHDVHPPATPHIPDPGCKPIIREKLCDTC